MKIFTRLILFLGVLAMGLTYRLEAQTTIIGGSTLNGDFETSGSWTVLNGAATNKWQISTGATAGFSGSQSIYVSNTASAPFAHTYTNTSTSVVFFYQDISIPAGETDIRLGFKYINNAESCCDHIKIYMVPTTFTPTVNTVITTTGSAPTGRVQLGATQYGGAINTWTTVSNISVPTAYAGTTVRIVFQWRNDSSIGSNPPGGVDDITLTSQLPPAPSCIASPTAPANAAVNISLTQTLSWPAAPLATSYDVYFGTSTNPPLVGNVTTITYNPGTLTGTTTYYWKIVPKNATGSASGCNEWSFTTLTPPTCPSSLGSPVTVASLPYDSGAGITTCGNGNNVTSTNATTCGSTSYFGGEDRTYIFTPTATTVHNIVLTTTTDDDAGIQLYNGCPFSGGGTCVANSQSTTGLTRTISPSLTAGITYYLVIDNFPAPACIASYQLTITPLGCTGPTLSTTTINNAACPTSYSYTFTVTNMGDATSYAVSNANGYTCSPATVTTAGTVVTVGPIPSGSASGITTLAHNSSATCNGTVASLTNLCPPANALCANAIAITGANTSGTTVGATTTGAPPTCVTTVTTGGVWYTYTSVSPLGESVTLDLCGASYDSKIGVYTGACGGTFTCVIGEDDDATCGGPGDDPSVMFTATFGTLYYIYVHGFSGAQGTFVLNKLSPPLPVELISFEGTALEKENKLTWATASEENTEWHILERSINGQNNWMEVGRTRAAGTTADIQRYEMMDKAPVASAYYRLQSLDFDSRFEYSKTIQIERKGGVGDMSIYPNPVSNDLNVDFTLDRAEEVTIQVVDLTGKLLSSEVMDAERGLNQRSMNVQHLQSGVYFVTMISTNGNVTKRLVKN
jgi:Secretion system C-terminal sorting domain